MIFGV